MKHKHLFILAMVLLPWSLQAQLTGWMGYINNGEPYIEDASIVRTADDNHVVVKYTHNGNDSLARISVHQFFTASPDSSIVPPITTISVPKELRISDMRALHDTVFFCGQYSSPSFDVGAAYGYVVLDTSVAAVYFNIFYDSCAIKLSRMVAYCIGGNYRIIAIGEDFSHTQQCFFQVDNVVSGSPSSSLYTYTHNLVEPQIEQIDDIALTDQYVVFVGRDLRVSPGCLYVRYANKWEGIPSPELQNTYRFLPQGPAIVEPVHAVAMLEDQVAVGYLSNETAEPNRLACLVSLHFSPALAQMVSFQQTTVYGDGSIAELAYMPTPRTVVMLWPTVYATITPSHPPYSRYLLWQPDELVGYSSFELYNRTKIAFSIDHLRGYAFASWGSLALQIQNYSPLFNGYSCLGHNAISIFPFPTIGPDILEEPLIINKSPINSNKPLFKWVYPNLIPICSH